MRLEAAQRRRRGLALTALVDVVFILLFFFMLAARPQPPRILPIEVAASARGSASDAVRVLVVAGGRLRHDGVEQPAAVLLDALRAARHRSIVLDAEPAATLQDLIVAFDAARAAGLAVQVAGAAP